MPVWKPEKLEVTPEDVIRGQGGKPEAVRNRNPRFIEIAEKAIEQGMKHLDPKVLYAEYKVGGLLHEKLSLIGGESIPQKATLSGKLISEHLAKAEKVIILISTVGPAIDVYVSRILNEDPILGLALDGVGGAAVEKLSNTFCGMHEALAAEQGLETTVPLSPGMIGWDVGQGQPQIFKALPGDEIGVALSEYGVMTPQKSLTTVLGFGKELEINGIPCDFCTMRETCNYRSHYPGEKPPSSHV